MKIVIIGHYWGGDLEAEFRKSLGDRHELAFFGTVDDVGIEDQMRTAEVVVSSHLPAALGRSAESLRLVHSAGAGVDKIHMSAVADGVPLCRTFNHGPAIAEHVVMAMVALRRQLLAQDRELRAGRWLNPGFDPALALPRGLDGQTVLVLGTGEIGVHLAACCQPFGMKVVGVNRSGRCPEGADFSDVVAISALDEVLPRADFLVVALPLTDKTRGVVDAHRLGLMKPTAHLVNVARGPLVDEAALYEALHQGRIAGAALDVWYRYPKSPTEPTPPAEQPFHRLDNVILTAHTSGNSTGTFGRRARDIIENITRLERGEPLLHQVPQEEQA